MKEGAGRGYYIILLMYRVLQGVWDMRLGGGCGNGGGGCGGGGGG